MILFLIPFFLFGYDENIRDEYLKNFAEIQKTIKEEGKKEEIAVKKDENKTVDIQKQKLELQQEIEFLNINQSYTKSKNEFDKYLRQEGLQKERLEDYKEIEKDGFIKKNIKIINFAGLMIVGNQKEMVILLENLDRLIQEVTFDISRDKKYKSFYEQSLFGIQPLNIQEDVKKPLLKKKVLRFKEGDMIHSDIKLISIHEKDATFEIKIQ